MIRPPLRSPLFPYPTLFRSAWWRGHAIATAIVPPMTDAPSLIQPMNDCDGAPLPSEFRIQRLVAKTEVAQRELECGKRENHPQRTSPPRHRLYSCTRKKRKAASKRGLQSEVILERATGLEPATSTLARLHSTN